MRSFRFLLAGLITFLASFQFLAGETPAEQPTPDLTYKVKMRDGYELPVDVFLPNPNAKDLPCILVRTPSSRETNNPEYASMAKWGYAVAVQDTRNVVDKKGEILPYWADGWGMQQDGYDTVEWLASQPFSNGKIGTVGKSALGITQLLMAPSTPPSLKCQYIKLAAPSLYQYGLFLGGKLRKSQVEGWIGDHSNNSEALDFVRGQPKYNDFWKVSNSLELAARVNVPAVHYGGWYDIFSQGTLDAFMSRQNEGGKGAKGTQKLVMGPWTHFNDDNNDFGEFELPVPARQLPMDISMKRWLDHHLKDEGGTLDEVPSVTYYVMGPLDGTPSSGHVWRTSDHWPIAATETAFHLTKSGELTTEKLEASEESLTFQHDPKNPVPTIGGRNLFLDDGPRDQRPLEGRDDVLVFSTQPLKQELEVTGHVKARIVVETDQQDTDIAVRLCDVYPDGRSVLIVDGIVSLSQTLEPEQLAAMRRGEKVEVEVDLWSTSQVFAKEHRIRLSVAGSNYPQFDKGLNGGLDEATAPVARNRVFVGAGTGSRLLLPVVPVRS